MDARYTELKQAISEFKFESKSDEIKHATTGLAALDNHLKSALDLSKQIAALPITTNFEDAEQLEEAMRTQIDEAQNHFINLKNHLNLLKNNLDKPEFYEASSKLLNLLNLSLFIMNDLLEEIDKETLTPVPPEFITKASFLTFEKIAVGKSAPTSQIDIFVKKLNDLRAALNNDKSGTEFESIKSLRTHFLNDLLVFEEAIKALPENKMHQYDAFFDEASFQMEKFYRLVKDLSTLDKDHRDLDIQKNLKDIVSGIIANKCSIPEAFIYLYNLAMQAKTTPDITKFLDAHLAVYQNTKNQLRGDIAPPNLPKPV